MVTFVPSSQPGLLRSSSDGPMRTGVTADKLEQTGTGAVSEIAVKKIKNLQGYCTGGAVVV